jgi:hypothetical protein
MICHTRAEDYQVMTHMTKERHAGALVVGVRNMLEALACVYWSHLHGMCPPPQLLGVEVVYERRVVKSTQMRKEEYEPFSFK